MNNKVALICEGSSEKAIMQILLEHDALKFSKNDLLNDEIIMCRNARDFTNNYLGKSFNFKINICRILDSKKEKFNIKKEYESKIEHTYKFVTQPEIEILYILYHDDFTKYTNKQKSKCKPSKYAAKHYNDVNNIKSFDENYNFWNLHFNELIQTLLKYKSKHNISRDCYCIADLLK